MADTMQVLLTGGTGFVGSHTAAELAERGHEVTVLARNPEDADLPPDVETVAGDVTDPDSLEGAFEGMDAVINFVALSPLFQPSGGDQVHELVHRRGTENVMAAMERAGVDRLVQLSALGADPEGPTHYIRAKGRADEAIRDSDLDWTIVQPSIVFGDGAEFLRFTALLTTPFVTGLPGGGSIPFQPIWIGEFTEILADALGEEHVGETYQIGGPEVLTLADVARAIERSKGRPLTVLPIPMVLSKLGLTVLGAIPKFPMGPDQYRSLTLDNRVEDNDVTAFGLDPAELRTLGDYLGLE